MPPKDLATKGNWLKFAAMLAVLACDLALNSILDFDSFNDEYSNNPTGGGRKASHLLLGLAGFQAVIEITVFLVLFLAMADTFLFRVGLLGLILKKFRPVLIIHPIYFVITIVSASYRVRHFDDGGSLENLWTDKRFIALSFIQKVVAIPYYLLNLRTTIKLGNPVYFNKEAWIALVKQKRLRAQSMQARRPGE